MGIKELNQYLLHKCSKTAIKKTHFTQLQRKIIVVDISIYLYKFMSDENFMESLYTFLSLFKYYMITPIFIFDGKPPPEKWALLKKRRWEKKDAAARLNELQNSVDSQTIEITQTLQKEMDELRRKSIRIKPEDFKNTKELIDAFGFVYYDAPGEADILCAYLVKSGEAWACLSDDMDMFLYGCPRVLRNLSLLKHSAVLYDTLQILSDIGLIHTDFLEMVVISGTDYNEGQLSLRKTFELHNEYISDGSNNQSFHNWLTIKIGSETDTNIKEICGYFDIINIGSELDIYKEQYKSDILEKHTNIPKIKEIMEPYGFIFV